MLKIDNLVKNGTAPGEPGLWKRAEQALRNCLSEVPFLKIKQVKKGGGDKIFRPDLIIKTNEKTLVVEVKDNGQPRFVREAANQLYRHRNLYPGAYPILIAPYLSPDSARILEQEGIGYVDLSGNCRLSFGKVYIHQEGNANQFARKRYLRSLYSPRASRVFRALLENPKRIWRLEALAGEAVVSLGQVYNVKKLLLDREWISFSREGLRMTAPERLLEEWSDNYDLEKSPRFDFYSLLSPKEIEFKLSDYCLRKKIPFALTGFSAADRYAPYVNYLRVMAYAQADLDQLARDLEFKRVPSGSNLSLFRPYDQGLLYHAKEIQGARVVSALQAYLDLIGFGERGKESAEFLFQEVIKPGWQ